MQLSFSYFAGNGKIGSYYRKSMIEWDEKIRVTGSKGVLMKRLQTNGGCTDTQRRHRQLMLVFLLSLLVLSVGMTAAAKETLNQTNLTLLKGRSASLKVRGTRKKVRFTSSKRSVATVNAK